MTSPVPPLVRLVNRKPITFPVQWLVRLWKHWFQVMIVDCGPHFQTWVHDAPLQHISHEYVFSKSENPLGMMVRAYFNWSKAKAITIMVKSHLTIKALVKSSVKPQLITNSCDCYILSCKGEIKRSKNHKTKMLEINNLYILDFQNLSFQIFFY